MSNAYIITLFIKLAVSAGAVFCSIMLWSKTRDAAWLCVIISTMLSFISFIFDLLHLYGIPQKSLWEFYGIDVPVFALSVLPWLFLVIAFVILINRIKN